MSLIKDKDLVENYAKNNDLESYINMVNDMFVYISLPLYGKIDSGSTDVQKIELSDEQIEELITIIKPNANIIIKDSEGSYTTLNYSVMQLIKYEYNTSSSENLTYNLIILFNGIPFNIQIIKNIFIDEESGLPPEIQYDCSAVSMV